MGRWYLQTQKPVCEHCPPGLMSLLSHGASRTEEGRLLSWSWGLLQDQRGHGYLLVPGLPQILLVEDMAGREGHA
jgi:hypothetical protein